MPHWSRLTCLHLTGPGGVELVLCLLCAVKGLPFLVSKKRKNRKCHMAFHVWRVCAGTSLSAHTLHQTLIHWGVPVQIRCTASDCCILGLDCAHWSGYCSYRMMSLHMVAGWIGAAASTLVGLIIYSASKMGTFHDPAHATLA